MKKVVKLFQTKAASVDEAAHTVQFVISDDSVDRYGEIVDQSTWDLKSYMKNPIVAWGHDTSEPENILGTSIEITPDGHRTIATLKFDTDINPKALMVFQQIVRGTLRCVSVGFMNHTFEYENDIPVLKDNELLEISVVPIPANANAIALSLKDGSLNRKDAAWLLESMKREATVLEEQLKTAQPDNEKEQKQVDEVKEAIGQLTTLMGELGTKMSEGLTALNESATKTNETVTALVDTLKEQKPAVAEPKPKLDADGKPVLDAEGKPVMEDPEGDPAKGGDKIDQPGAGNTDEIDEDAELTPEQEAEANAALDEMLAAE